jgi:ribonuclease HI
MDNSKWSYTDQLGLNPKQKTEKDFLVVQQKWTKKLKEQTSNYKELSAIHLALLHFLPVLQKENFKSILIRTDNSAAMYNINKRAGALNLYQITRKIWYLMDNHQMFIKAVHNLNIMIRLL